MCGDPDKHAGWADERKCECGMEHQFSARIELIEVEMMSAAERAARTAGRLAARLLHGHFKRGWHTAVQVQFKCDKCGHIFLETYDIIDVHKEKRRRVGHFLTTGPVVKSSTMRVPYDFVDYAHKKMWGQGVKRGLFGNDCKTWSFHFFRIIALEAFQ